MVDPADKDGSANPAPFKRTTESTEISGTNSTANPNANATEDSSTAAMTGDSRKTGFWIFTGRLALAGVVVTTCFASSGWLRSQLSPLFLWTTYKAMSAGMPPRQISTNESLTLQINSHGLSGYRVKIYKRTPDQLTKKVKDLARFERTLVPSVPQEYFDRKHLHDPVATVNGGFQFREFLEGQAVAVAPKLPLGDYIYVVEGISPEGKADRTSTGAFRVSDLGLIIRAGTGNKVLLKAFNVVSLKPVPNALIEVFRPTAALSDPHTEEQSPLAKVRETRTWADGCVEIDAKYLGAGNLNYSTDPGGSDGYAPRLEFAATSSDGRSWSESGYGAYYDGDWEACTSAPDLATGSSQPIVDLISDRTVYRLGQDVYFKGIVRNIEANGLQNPGANKPVGLTITDPEGKQVQVTSLRTGEFGDFDGHFKIANDAKTGSYTITTSMNEGTSTSNATIEVMQYRKPEYEVTVAPISPVTIAGDKLQVKVNAKYFFGGPVKNAKVHFSAYTFPNDQIRSELKEAPAYYKFFSNRPRQMEMPRYYGGASAPIEGDAVTDENGAAIITVSTPAIGKEEVPFDGRYGEKSMSFNVSVTDLSRKTADGSGDALLTAGQYALVLKSDSTVLNPGEALNAKVTAIDYEKHPVSNKLVKVAVEYWETPYGENPKMKVVAQQSVTTDAHGKADISVKLPPALPGGQYHLSVAATDGAGHSVRDYSYFWLSAPGIEQWVSDTQEVKIELDKPVYKPGEKVRAVISLPSKSFGRSAALASVSGVELYHYQGLELNNSTNVVEFPVKKEYTPECMLNIVAVNDKRKTLEAAASVLIYPEPFVLNVDVKPEKTEYKPADTASINFAVKNANGTPASNTELIVSVVDESLYAVKPDTHDIAQSFYSTRYFQSRTLFGFDESQAPPVLPTPELINIGWLFFPQNRSTVCCERLCAQSADAESRGGGGYFAPTASAPVLVGATNGTIGPQGDCTVIETANPTTSFASLKSVRSSFLDSAFWSGKIVTNSGGLASVKFKLPDNLTGWRVTASAASKGAEFGTGKAQVTVSKEVLARLSLPRFFTQGDQGVISGMVHNYSSKEQTVKVVLKASNQLAFSTPLEQTVRITPKGIGRLSWPVTVKGEGTAKLELTALGQTDSDALRQEIPVRGFSFPVFASKNGILRDDTLVTALPMKLTADAIPGTGKFEISVASSAIGPVLGSFDELIDYPYGCTEQTMSRMMPSVVAMELHRKLDLPLDKGTVELFKDVQRRCFIKLAEHQNDDGGWGWWRGDQSNPYLTAYVMEGLYLLRQAGYTVDQSMIDSGKTRLKELCKTKPEAGRESRTDLAYVAYASALWGDTMEVDALINQVGSSIQMGPEGLSYLTIALKKQGQDKAARGVYDQLLHLANKNWEYTTWEHTSELSEKLGERHAVDYTYRFTGVETTALAMQAVLAMEPDNEKLLSSIRRWIILQHDQNGWVNTKTTARVFIAMLEDELHGSRQKPTNFTASALADGKSLVSFVFNKNNQYGKEQSLTVPLKGSEAQLQIKKFGSGRLYYSSLLSYKRPILPGRQVVARSSPPDLTIERKFYKLVPYVDAKTRQKVIRAVELTDEGVKAGETILMKLQINSPVSVPYVMIDAALPSGAEVTSKSNDGVNMPTSALPSEGYAMDYWWSHQDVLDDRIVFFANMLPAGKCEFQSLLRMEMPGKFNVNPVTFEGMYTKAVRGYSSGDRLVVNE
ncbi:MAG: hypothetical protein K2W95_26690 [Candidatus Obscuribacterales bacterium]|nr:hypothetical protein [Candidatus Obscuribacterales bacterium]